jgi:hypothetical protein
MSVCEQKGGASLLRVEVVTTRKVFPESEPHDLYLLLFETEK